MLSVKASAPAAIQRAAALLLEGGLVAFPTETVYGLGALASNDRAVGRVFAAKGRPSSNPLIAHVADRGAAAIFAEMDERAHELANAFWPGPLTLVLPLKVPSTISRVMTAGLATVAVRVPVHPVARSILEAVELPVAAPSANRSGQISPTTANHVAEDLASEIDLLVDGGSCAVGVESTVIDLSRPDRACLLRPGGLETGRIEELIGPLEGFASHEIPRAPGMLLRHYAPHTPLRLGALEPRSGEALLAFGPDVPKGASMVLNLSERGDLGEAAANLYGMLRKLDRTRPRVIAVMPVPRGGLGEAINDRLARACATEEEAAAA